MISPGGAQRDEFDVIDAEHWQTIVKRVEKQSRTDASEAAFVRVTTGLRASRAVRSPKYVALFRQILSHLIDQPKDPVHRSALETKQSCWML
jgi:hypothetical protein